jgi:hypothetical protein
LERVDACAFCGSGLKSSTFPSSVVVLGERGFCECKFLARVAFESGSRWERIEKEAFSGSELKLSVIPSSGIVLGKGSFSDCWSLESVTFESGSRLEWIEAGSISSWFPENGRGARRNNRTRGKEGL